jgi:hypothetical protein
LSGALGNAESTAKLKETTEALSQAIGVEQSLTARLNEANALLNQPKNTAKHFAA